MIALTCLNGEHFSVDPSTIERIEERGDTLVVLVDGTHFVTETDVDTLLHAISASHARVLVNRARVVNGFAATPTATLLARRKRALAATHD